MKKTLTYVLAGMVVLLGLSSCASARKARLERKAERERLAYEQWQRDSTELARQQFLIDSLRLSEMERDKLH